MKKKNIVLAEIIIIIIIALALLLPRIIGKINVDSNDGFVHDIESLNGHNFGATNTGIEKQIILDYFPKSKCEEYDDLNDAIKAIQNKNIDGFISNLNDAKKAIENNDDLVLYQRPFTKKGLTDVEMTDFYYLILRKNDCGYTFTTKSTNDVKKPGVKVAALMGAYEPIKLQSTYPECTIEYYDSFPDTFNAVANGKADFCFGYDDSIEYTLPSFTNLASIPEPFTITKVSFACSKTEKGNNLIKEFDSYLEKIQNNGLFTEIYSKWRYGTEDDQILEEVNFTGENGFINVCTPCTWYPNTYYKDNQMAGTFIDIVNLFCEEKGYIPNFSVSTFPGEIAGLSSGEYDLMADLCEATEERSQSVNFTRPALLSYSVFITLGDKVSYKTVSKASYFFNSLKEKFYKNFIEQERYKMIFDGLWTTVKISVLSCLLGTIIAMIICAMRMSDNIFLNAFSRIYIKVIQGTPIVVVLLILYYVIFSGSSVGGFWVSVIGFSIDFSAYTAEIFRSSIETVPDGQITAGRALGFSSFQTFTKIVFPQALISIIPVYSGQFISLVKSTSIVGYIAVQDLTKMSDLIRSSTYEAFFPLISTAVIYFVISSLLIQVLKLISKKIDPLERSRIPKGVKTDAI